MRSNPKSLNVLFIFGLTLTVLCGFLFVFLSPGFISTILTDGSIIMCSEMGSSSPDDNATPLIAILLVPSLLVRLFRFSSSVSFIEVAYFVFASVFGYMFVVTIRNCADFLPTLIIDQNIWLMGLGVGYVISNVCLVLLLYFRMK